MRHEILALDLATRTGWARGAPGQRPVSGSVQFGKPEASNNAVFAHALTWTSTFLESKPRPTVIIIEGLLPYYAKQGETSQRTRDRLSGLHAIVRAAAHLHGIYEISTAGAQQVRRHFIGDGSLQRDAAKRAVIHRCNKLGWNPVDDNAADALALWSFACGLLDPEWSLKLSPLFNKELRA